MTRFDNLYNTLHHRLLNDGQSVNTGHWQGVSGTPHAQTIELRAVQVSIAIDESSYDWALNVKPNLPWAEDHFKERVGGEPLNPGEQYKNWPWYAGGVEDHKGDGTFSHTYMERLWPRRAGKDGTRPAPVVRVKGPPHKGLQPQPSESIKVWGDNEGIRYRYGDLSDVLDLLEREPYTRQAYVPLWFPEDTGATDGQRVPCTLGYHLMLREGKLHCYYPMRSLDFLRYFRDDAYMAGRLVQWVIAQLIGSEHTTAWDEAVPGDLTMFAHSLHVFQGDRDRMEREAAETAR